MDSPMIRQHKASIGDASYRMSVYVVDPLACSSVEFRDCTSRCATSSLGGRFKGGDMGMCRNYHMLTNIKPGLINP